jgi:hypothetical protein
MRPLALLATVLISVTATAAGAQSLTAPQSLTGPPVLKIQIPSSSAQNDEAAALALLNTAAFAPAGASTAVDPISRMIEREGYQPGAGPVRWTGAEALLSPNTALRVSVGGTLRTAGGLPLNLRGAQYDANAYDVTVIRDWPGAIAFESHTFGVDVTPHAGVGMTSLGGSAEAGATLRIMTRDAAAAERLRALGVRDGASFGDRGRWYLFAAASGRAVGMNMLHSDQGWDRAGWSTDATSRLTGDAQVGVGWRKGAMQTSFGYIHRETKGANMLMGVDPKKDDVVAFSLSIRRR